MTVPLDLPALGESLEALSELLAGYADMPTALSQGLRYILGRIGRSGGMLIVQGPDDHVPVFWLVENAPEDWKLQLDDPESTLRRLCYATIDPNGVEVAEDVNSPALVFPLATISGQQGILLIGGPATSPEDTAFLSRAGRHLGRAIFMSRNHSLSFEADKALNILGVIVSGLDSNVAMDEIQAHVIAGIRDSFQCEAASMALMDDVNQNLLVKKCLAGGEEWIYQVTLESNQGVLGECLQTGRAILANNPKKLAHFREEIDGVPGVASDSLLYVPLRVKNRIIGVLQLHNKHYAGFTPYDQFLLLSLADSFANLLNYLQVIQRLRVVNANLEASRWELVRSRDTLRSLFDNMPNPLYIVDRGYHLILANIARARHSMCDPRQLVGNPCYEMLFQRSDPCPGCLVGETFFNRKNTQRTLRQWGEDGDTQEWEISTYPIIDEQGQVVQAIVFEQDVTEKNRLEAIVAQSEKLAAVGQLAAGIAHEISNPLTVVLANAQILLREIPKDSDWVEAVDLIDRAGSRALHVVRNLLNFARKEHYEFKPTDINLTIEHALEMLKHELLSRSVELVFEPADDLPLVMASADHLQGVWLNIILNAMDATTQEGGRIRVGTSQHERNIRVTINDNGQGIPPEHLKRIFEPFYTTKDPGRGTGLGLSVCHRTIKQHGGHILVESQVGYGTIFTVVLPIY